jgi:hypothetical protein
LGYLIPDLALEAICDLKTAAEGKHIAFSAGTGVLVYLDIVARLII